MHMHTLLFSCAYLCKSECQHFAMRKAEGKREVKDKRAQSFATMMNAA